MTKTEKDALIDALEAELTTYGAEVLYDGTITYKKAWLEDDVKYAILNLPEEETEHCDEKCCTKASLNYEEEYNRLAERFTRINADWAQLRDRCETLTKENEKMCIAIKTIEFVTGRKLEL